MSGINFNVTDRQASVRGQTTTEIFDASDFPNPLVSGHYIVKAPVTVTAAFVVSADQFITISSDDVINNPLTLSGTGTLFSIVNTNSLAGLFLRDITIVMTATNIKFISIVGGGFSSENAQFIAVGNNSLIGDVNDGFLSIERTSFSGFTFALIMIDISFGFLERVNLVPRPGSTATAFVLLGRVFRFDFGSIITDLENTYTLFAIGAGVRGPISIDKCEDTGLGTYFDVGSTKAIQGFSDVSPASITISSVSNATFAVFLSAVPHGFVLGDLIVHSGFADSEYNGPQTITSIDSDTTYKTGVLFVTTGGGTAQFQLTRVNSTAHALGPISGLTITDTVNYDAGYRVESVFDVNNFDINAIFVITETGNFNTNSLTEKDPQVNVQDAGRQKSSMISGGWKLAGNTDDTVIAATDVYQDINFGTGSSLTPLSFNERINVVNDINGTIEYLGINPAVLTVAIEFLVVADSNQGRKYTFKMEIDRGDGSGFVDLPDNVESVVDVQGNLVDILFNTFRSVLMQEGDQVKYQVKGPIADDFLAPTGAFNVTSGG